MSRPIARYRPSRRYLLFCLLGLAAAALSAWAGTRWGLAWSISSGLFLLTALSTLMLALRPTIEIHETHLLTGGSVIFWNEIRRLDRVILSHKVPMAAPLILRLTLAGGREWTLLHTGDADSCLSLLRHMYRYSRSAVLDGIPYHEFWSEPVTAPPLELVRPRILMAEDEEEVERLFQQLKSVGRMDQQTESRDRPSPDHGADQGVDHSMDQRGSDEL